MVNLANWIHDAVTDTEKGGRCTALTVVHIASGGIESAVYVKKLPDKIDATQVPDWADLLRQKAKDYASGIPGAQTFCLQAFYDNGQFPGAKQPFVEAGYTEMEGLATESPTQKGLLQQMMRHNEAILARTNERDRVLNDVFMKMLEAKQRETEVLKKENVELFGLAKTLLMDVANKSHEHRLKEIEAQQTAAIRAEIAKQVPRLLNTITGREVVPQNIEDTQTFEDLIDALTQSGGVEEALAGLTQKLPPALLMRLGTRIQQGLIAREKEAKARTPVDQSDREIDGGLQ